MYDTDRGVRWLPSPGSDRALRCGCGRRIYLPCRQTEREWKQQQRAKWRVHSAGRTGRDFDDTCSGSLGRRKLPRRTLSPDRQRERDMYCALKHMTRQAALLCILWAASAPAGAETAYIAQVNSAPLKVGQVSSPASQPVPVTQYGPPSTAYVPTPETAR